MKRAYDHKTVIKMHDDGALQREIAERTGYSLTAVKKILCANGRTRKRETGESYRCPIYPVEIARYRERLQIGQKKQCMSRSAMKIWAGKWQTGSAPYRKNTGIYLSPWMRMGEGEPAGMST